MFSVFESLPSEVQQLVFENLYDHYDDNIADIKECMLVCNSWKNLCQILLYKTVTLRRYSQSEKLLNTLENNPHLASLVVKLSIYFGMDHTNLNQGRTVARLLTHLPNLKDIFCLRGRYFELLSDALSANHLPYLCRVQPPDLAVDIYDYFTCAMLLKERLLNLSIKELAIKDDNDIFYPDYFHRFFDVLHTLKTIEELQLQRMTNKKIELIEKATQRCPLLKRLDIEFISNNENQIDYSNIVTPITTKSLLGSSNVINLNLSGGITGDPKFVNYIIHKFPNLKTLTLNISNPTHQSAALDKFTHIKFLSYLTKIAEVKISQICWEEQTLIDTIGPFWETISQSRILSVKFNYGLKYPNGIEMDLEIQDGFSKNIIHYSPTSNSGLEHMHILERHGEHIDCLKLSGINSKTVDFSQQQKNTLYELILLHPLKHCAKLKRLSIVNSTLSGSSVATHIHPYKRTLDSLDLEHCMIERNGFFKKLSERFTSIRCLRLCNNTYVGSNEYVGRMNIDMLETQIDTLYVSYISQNLYDETNELLVMISVQKSCSYFMYNFERKHCSYFMYKSDTMDDCLFKPVSKARYNNGCNLGESLIVEISCKSIKNLIVDHLGKKNCLTIF